MRLIDYGAGEMIDRLSILSLKLLYAEAVGKPTDHFRTEFDTLLLDLQRITVMQVSLVTTQRGLLDLSAVNSALWQLEDRLRAFRREFLAERDCEQVVEIAFDIQKLNDRRAAIIHQINRDTRGPDNQHFGEEEKLYVR